MDRKNDIFEWFINSNKSGCCYIGGLPDDFDARYYRDENSYGVMVSADGIQMEIDEHFSNIRLYTSYLFTGLNQEGTYLILSCALDGENFSEKFALMCDDFIDPGEEGCRRCDLLKNPFSWWSDWKILVGNVSRDRKPYSVLGEMISYDYLLTIGESPEWEGPDSGTVDIRAKNIDCEVKSTTMRANKQITISSIHQLDSIYKPLHLFRCCFERSESGVCINSILPKLKAHGADMDVIEMKLESLGYSRGSSSRSIGYRLLEFEDYPVDESFPRIVADSFVDGGLPHGVESINYSVSLVGLKSVPLKWR